MTIFKRTRDGDKSGRGQSGFLRSRTPKELGPLLIFILSTMVFWGSWWIFMRGQSLIGQIILKFVIYLSVVLWLNSAFYMRELAVGTDVDTLKFQKKQVTFTLWIFAVFFLIEIPTWLYVSVNP